LLFYLLFFTKRTREIVSRWGLSNIRF
jgi:hypothetical protein